MLLFSSFDPSKVDNNVISGSLEFYININNELANTNYNVTIFYTDQLMITNLNSNQFDDLSLSSYDLTTGSYDYE